VADFTFSQSIFIFEFDFSTIYDYALVLYSESFLDTFVNTDFVSFIASFTLLDFEEFCVESEVLKFGNWNSALFLVVNSTVDFTGSGRFVVEDSVTWLTFGANLSHILGFEFGTVKFLGSLFYTVFLV